MPLLIGCVGGVAESSKPAQSASENHISKQK